MSEQRRLEQALREALRALTAETQRAAHLQIITVALAQANSAEAVAEVIITEGAAAVGTPSGTLSLVSDDGRGLTLAASVRMPPALLALYHDLPLDAGTPARTAAVAAVRARRPLWFSSNAELGRDYPELAAARAPAHLEAAAVIPIVLGERALGVIVFTFTEERTFGEADRAFLRALAQQCAQALERLRLYAAERNLRLHEQQARAQAEAGRQRLAFLVEVSSALSATTDYDAVMAQMAPVLVPTLADYAAVYTLADDGRIVQVALAHHAPEKQARLEALHTQVELTVDSPHSLIAQAMRTGQPLLDAHFDWQAQYAAAPPAVQAYLAALRPNSHMIVPLIARGRALGVLVLAASEADRRLTETDLSLATEVAARAALAADNAWLLHEAQRLNAQLEQRVEERTAALLQSEARFHWLVDSVQDYAIFLLDPDGRVASWNTGAERIKGYRPEEIIGQHFSRFYTPEDVAKGVPAKGLARARQVGHFEAEGWRVRQDGTRFWANVVITPAHDAQGTVVGYAKVTRDLTERKSFEDELRSSHAQLRQESAARQAVQQQLEQAREAERARIAREVHDELGGALTGLKMSLRRLRSLDNLPPQAPGKLDELADEIDATVQIVRRIAQDLRPAVLDDFGLLAALEWQFAEFKKRSELETVWHSTLGEHTELNLPSEVAIGCFRIFQEALTNIARHAQATRVEVDIRLEAGRLVLRVADNGLGLAATTGTRPGHLGLAGMRERAAHLAGELRIESPPSGGTTVTLKVPVAIG